MRIGNGIASMEHVRELLQLVNEWELGGLRADDISPKDKMNVMAYVRLTSPVVQHALKSRGNHHTAAVFLHCIAFLVANGLFCSFLK
jgi:hypothetical protein